MKAIAKGGHAILLVAALALLLVSSSSIEAASFMYWTDPNTDKIQRANLDEPSFARIMSATSSSPISCAGYRLQVPFWYRLTPSNFPPSSGFRSKAKNQREPSSVGPIP